MPLHPKSSYNEFNLDETDASAILVDSNPAVDDVPGRFRRIALHGDLLAASDGGAFMDNRVFRYTNLNQHGLNAGINHFQGMQRLSRGQYMVLTGGDSTEPCSHLFVVRMGSRRAHGVWGSNLVHACVPSEQDAVVRVISLDRDLWHAGGLGLLGNILAVPLEGDGRSSVMFLNMADPENPTRLPVHIDRRGIAKAGAVTLAKLPEPSGGYVCIVWREDGDDSPVGRLDIYRAPGPDFANGFESRPLTLPFPGLKDGIDRDPQYQSLCLIEPAAGAFTDDGGHRYFMIGLENDSPVSPFGNGANVADLFEVRFDPAMLGDHPNGELPTVSHIDTIEFHAPREYSNMDAAVGVYLDSAPHGGDAGPRLHVYASYHWRVERTIRFAEFCARPDPAQSVTDIADAWIDLYEHDRFRGRRLTIHGNLDATIADYSRIFVQDSDFNERVSSVRYHLPDGVVYRLFRNRNFTGSSLPLAGTGVRKEIADLKKRKFGDTVSSSKYDDIAVE